jgi:hypothetical protein
MAARRATIAASSTWPCAFRLGFDGDFFAAGFFAGGFLVVGLVVFFISHSYALTVKVSICHGARHGSMVLMTWLNWLNAGSQ